MVAVLSASGKKLMPTNPYRARKLLKRGRAKIYSYRPIFTIQLLDREDGDVQPTEYCCDTGYQHIGISIKSRKHEYVNEQRDLLPDETEKHKNRRSYRRDRRNRKRHRKARWNNRKNSQVVKDGFAPSIRNKRDIHIELYRSYVKVLPIVSATFEMGQFDTQVLKAIAENKPIPIGEDYQHGDRYGYSTLREAAFARDNYKCVYCNKSALSDKTILQIHHVGYWKHDRTNRLGNLVTICTKCHIPKNHKPGGILYGKEPTFESFKDATFMTMVRYNMFAKIQEVDPSIECHMTYGAMTKIKRKDVGVKKTHSNDAYAMGEFHPKWRTDFHKFQKNRRNNRVLCKFYDAKYIDIRDGSTKKGAELSCGRTNCRESRMSDKNERIYRGNKVSKGRNSIRTQRYPIRPGDVVYANGVKAIVNGTNCKGKNVILTNKKSCSVNKIKLIKHCGAWKEVS